MLDNTSYIIPQPQLTKLKPVKNDINGDEQISILLYKQYFANCLYYWRFRYSFICQGTSARRQRRNLFGLRVRCYYHLLLPV